MRKLFIISFLLVSIFVKAQNDSLPSQLHFSGNVGVTNNGISIIPTFSLNAPAFNTSLSISKGGKFSFDPDIRLTFDGKKGGALFWLRYKLITTNKFKLTVGAHPAYNFAIKSITENGKTWNITQARRFWATEVAPSYVFNKHFAMGVYYLNGHGLQKDGPLNTHFVTFNTSLLNIPLVGGYNFNFNPQVYYLKIDREDGYYLSGAAWISHMNSPFSLIGSYNKEIQTNISGSKDFVWNVTLSYRFANKYKRFN